MDKTKTTVPSGLRTMYPPGWMTETSQQEEISNLEKTADIVGGNPIHQQQEYQEYHEIPDEHLDLELEDVDGTPDTHEQAESQHKIGRDVRDKTRKLRFRKLVSGTDFDKHIKDSPHLRDYRYGDLVHLMGRREAAASEIAHAIGWDYFPKTKIRKEVHHATDHRKKKSMLESSFIDGHLLLDSPIMIKLLGNAKLTDQNVDTSLYRTLSKFDQDSLHRASLFNWLINNRDSHLNNFMVTKDNKLVPIDYGISFDAHPQEYHDQNHPNASDRIAKSYWRLHPTKAIPKPLLQQIHASKDKILDIISKRVLPNYPEDKREEVLANLRRRLDIISKAAKSKEDTPAYAFYTQGRNTTMSKPILEEKTSNVRGKLGDATNERSVSN